jgi:hypothetical protein
MPKLLRAASLATVMGASVLLASATATLAAPVDPATLTPPPPPGARCFTTGPGRVTCDTVLDLTFANQPDFEAPCGQLYVSGTDFRDGLRFYEDGLIVRRHVTFAINATLSLSPTGDGPTVTLIARAGWWNVWPVPGGNDQDAIQISTGLDVKVIGPGIGAEFQIAGRFKPDESHTGSFTAFSDESLAAICAALGA